MDFREGGYWHYAMIGPEGEEHWSLAEYKVIQPKKKYSGLDVFADENGNINKALPQSEWEVSFIDEGEWTHVQIIVLFEDLSQLETTIQMGFKEGMTTAMDGLDELLSALRGKAK